jgi:hypothetical protein
MTTIVNVLVSGEARERIHAIRYVLEELSLRLGLRLRPYESVDVTPDLLYGDATSGVDAPRVPYVRDCYSPKARFVATGEPALWVPDGAGAGAAPDLVGGAFRLLAMLDEGQVQDQDRDRRGVFSMNALPTGRRDAAKIPLVEHHATALLSLLGRAGRPPVAAPMWPGGHRWAVLLTHDTDAVRISNTHEVLFNAVKTVVRRDSTRAHMVVEGLRRRGSSIVTDPLFGFPGWRDSTESLGIRSAFYLFVRRKVSADVNDCRSTVADPAMDWGLIREMADEGWEFGLHAPIKAKLDIDEFILGKRFLEEHLARPIYGLRHHYWALDWRAPHLTHRQHVNAGFRYDLSMAYRDSAGFRSRDLSSTSALGPWTKARARHVLDSHGHDGWACHRG